MALFTVPGRESLHTEFVSDYAASQPSKSVARGSVPWLLGRVVSGVLWSLLARLLFFDKIRLPDTAVGDYLNRWGTVFDFPAKTATPSRGTSALRVTTTGAYAITTGALLTHQDGTIYEVTSDYSGGSAGTVDVDVSAVSTGLATNKIIGETLTFQSPPANVDAVATLVVNLATGTDNEDPEAYRARLLAHIGDPPTGGAIPDYIEWALEVVGNATAYVWKNRRGLGTIDVAVLGIGSGTERIITDIATTQDYLDDVTRRPGNVADVLVLAVDGQPEDVDIQISQDETQFKWDWVDNGTGYSVTAENAGAKTITVPTAPATLLVGMRLTVNGEEAKVIARATTVLTVELTSGNAWFADTAIGTNNMFASGDLVVPVRDSVLALFDRLGPARDTRYAQTQWESSLQVDSIITAGRNVRGCTKVQVNTPAADVVPVDALNDSTSVPLIVPGTVIVRRLA